MNNSSAPATFHALADCGHLLGEGTQRVIDFAIASHTRRHPGQPVHIHDGMTPRKGGSGFRKLAGCDKCN
ncbi:hypothetical protein GMA1_57 [Gordonia phage GMA1]|uniref:hypothetical protein n=1 Tax=Gordonia phage GMA1 TaxID=1647470 RepID=UPI0007B62DEA|nr:hypothetical protein BH788_gp57 [Gordonia phage GMA1]AKJ72154.1 hypothetical protein GMA1_57 [Gordonia phage GMA1]